MSGEKSVRTGREPTWRSIGMVVVPAALFLGQVALCVIFYNWGGLDVALYVGWATLAFGLLWVPRPVALSKRRARRAEGQSWMSTTALVETGIYATVRHPMYLGFTLIVLALVLISQYCLAPVLVAPIVAYLLLVVRQEEKTNVEKFGDAYKEYMRTVPILDFLTGAERVLGRRT